MKVQRSMRCRIGTFAVLFALTGIAVAGAVQAQSLVVYAHQGPGVGSVKTPPFCDAAYLAYSSRPSQASADLYFHTANGQPANSMYVMQGPGPWSPKAAGIH